MKPLGESSKNRFWPHSGTGQGPEIFSSNVANCESVQLEKVEQ
jgi:hypothetical protein